MLTPPDAASVVFTGDCCTDARCNYVRSPPPFHAHTDEHYEEALRLRQLTRSHSGKSVLVASRVESTVVTTPVFCVATTVTRTTNLRRSPDELPPSTNGTRRVQRRTQPRTTDDLPLLPQPPTITLGRTACVHHGATSNAAMSTYIVHGGRHYDYGSWRVAARVNRCS